MGLSIPAVKEKSSAKQTPQNGLLWLTYGPIINTSQNIICLFCNPATYLTHAQLVTHVTLGSPLLKGL